MATTTFSPTAFAYAQSLLELATPQGQAVQIGDELAEIRQIVDTDETFRLFLADPSISEATRATLIERVFKGRVSDLVYGFIQVVNRKGRLGMFQEIAGAYQERLDEQQGKVDVDLTVAHSLDPTASWPTFSTASARAWEKTPWCINMLTNRSSAGSCLRIRDQADRRQRPVRSCSK